MISKCNFDGGDMHTSFHNGRPWSQCTDCGVTLDNGRIVEPPNNATEQQLKDLGVFSEEKLAECRFKKAGLEARKAAHADKKTPAEVIAAGEAAEKAAGKPKHLSA